MKHVERFVWSLGYRLSWRLLRRLLSERLPPYPRVERAALYIHIPFCVKPCRFCCFVRFAVDEASPPPSWYFASLMREIDWAADCIDRVEHVHVGGGTPSLYPELLAEVVDRLRGYFTGFQLTIEVHPSDVIDDEKFSVLSSLRVSRWSLGVQSFHDCILRSIGRVRHSGAEALEAVKRLVKLGGTVNVDLVFGAEGQSVEHFISDVRTVVESGATQVTIYPLLGDRWIHHPEMYRMYVEALKIFEDERWVMETPWTFSKGVQLREYIVDSPDYIGLGVSSISMVGRSVYVNTFSLERYAKLVEARGWSATSYTTVSRLERHLYNLLISAELRVAKLWTRLGSRIARLAYLVGEARRGMYSALTKFRRTVLAGQLY